jgi:DNA-binding CsgD family transcriptional regulator/tetratricopeptide (TPR) repeat protein
MPPRVGRNQVIGMLRRQLLAPDFVGRESELDELVRLLDDVRAGRGATALIGGEAGIGKTRLCREVKALAARHDVRVIEGRSSPAESAVPYGPFMDALRFRLARGEGEAAARVLQPILGHVAPLFRELPALPGRRSAAAVPAPFEPIFEVVRRLAQLGPALLLLEDVHWADATSRELLHYLARRIADVPVLMVATYRTDELHPGHPVHRMVATLAKERLAHCLDLESLTGPQVEAMLGAILGTAPEADFVAAVRERTDGNPLYIEELISVLGQTRQDRHPHYGAADLAGATPPATIHELVLGRIEPLGPEALEVLTVAAVIGRRFSFELLARALDWPEERLLGVVEEAVARGLLVERQEAGREFFAFRHTLMQEVLYTGTIGRRRRLWHRRVAAALERSGEDTALPHTTLAHHYRAGGDLRKARDHAILAGDEAARLCAWREAEAMYEEALSALEQVGPDPALEAEILERMAEVAWWQNRIALSEQYARDALVLHRSLGEPRRTAAMLRRLAKLYADQHGDLERALATLGEALALLEASAAGNEQALVVNDLGRLCLARGEYTAAEAWLERGLELATERRDCAEEALALVLLGRLAITQGRIDAGICRLELARVLLEDAPIPVERAVEVFHAGIRALEAAREHERARIWVEAAIAFATAYDTRVDLAVFRAYSAAVDRRAGRWAEALRDAANAVEELKTAQRAEVREALRILGDLHRVRGNYDAARAAYHDALSRGERDASIGLALVLLGEGRAEEGAAALRRAILEHPAEDRLWAFRLLPLIVEAELHTGCIEEARRACDRLEALVRGSDYRPGPTVAAHAAGLVRAAENAHGEAARLLRRAIDGWSALGLPHERARALLDLADLLLQRRPRSAAGIAAAREAAERLDALGAVGEVDRARGLLRRAGVRLRRRADVDDVPPPLDRLSRRERQVLSQLARGMTNKQIARTLSIRPKTVGNHVSSILAKLGCSTRTQATAIALATRFAANVGAAERPPDSHDGVAAQSDRTVPVSA